MTFIKVVVGFIGVIVLAYLLTFGALGWIIFEVLGKGLPM